MSTTQPLKRVYVLGGGTFSPVRTHLSLAAPAFGKTAIDISNLCVSRMKMNVVPVLTQMAKDPNAPPELWHWDMTVPRFKSIVTNDDAANALHFINQDPLAKIVFMSVAMCDFDGNIVEETSSEAEGPMTWVTKSGHHASRLDSNKQHILRLTPAQKVIGLIRNGGTYVCTSGYKLEFKPRKDIFLVGFKTTSNKTEDEQYLRGLKLCKEASCNLVLANDVVTRTNMIITPEEARYHVTIDRQEVLRNLVEMASLRSHLTFTRSTVVAGYPVPWNSAIIPATLREVVDHCISNEAYKPFNGATVGHFAAKVGEKTFVTSRRKTDFNKLSELGLVLIESDGPDSVIAYGSKPSVGGQSQRIVFNDHQDYDCIVHFHCPIREGSKVPTASQREYECGSHECGQNTSSNLRKFAYTSEGEWVPADEFTGESVGYLSAVYLDQHGPNVVFNRSLSSKAVIDFIESNFDLAQKTGGLV